MGHGTKDHDVIWNGVKLDIARYHYLVRNIMICITNTEWTCKSIRHNALCAVPCPSVDECDVASQVARFLSN